MKTRRTTEQRRTKATEAVGMPEQPRSLEFDPLAELRPEDYESIKEQLEDDAQHEYWYDYTHLLACLTMLAPAEAERITISGTLKRRLAEQDLDPALRDESEANHWQNKVQLYGNVMEIMPEEVTAELRRNWTQHSNDVIDSMLNFEISDLVAKGEVANKRMRNGKEEQGSLLRPSKTPKWVLARIQKSIHDRSLDELYDRQVMIEAYLRLLDKTYQPEVPNDQNKWPELIQQYQEAVEYARKDPLAWVYVLDLAANMEIASAEQAWIDENGKVRFNKKQAPAGQTPPLPQRTSFE